MVVDDSLDMSIIELPPPMGCPTKRFPSRQNPLMDDSLEMSVREVPPPMGCPTGRFFRPWENLLMEEEEEDMEEVKSFYDNDHDLNTDLLQADELPPPMGQREETDDFVVFEPQHESTRTCFSDDEDDTVAQPLMEASMEIPPLSPLPGMWSFLNDL